MENPINNKILATADIHRNLSSDQLYQAALDDGEGKASKYDALVVTTGEKTGRSANDKFFVKEKSSQDKIHWGETNVPMTEESFNKILKAFEAYAQEKKLYVHDLLGGADRDFTLPVTIITEFAWHGLFSRHMLVRPSLDELKKFSSQYTIINFPKLKLDPSTYGTNSETVIAINLDKKIILICGTQYAGETKKSVFTLLNYLLPDMNTMPMHCSVNTGSDGKAAVFFGLSGTGKTTLSADPNRALLGDDEHGWSEDGLFNFEGGCYAKLIRLSKEAEPEIFATTQMKNTIIENVVMLDDGELDLDNNSITENTRGAYPLEYIPGVTISGKTSHPKNIIMLTADAFGVLPPIAKLTPSQAMYHFLSGYTAKVAGTEMGLSSEPTATFSTCFGAPFMPRNPIEYGNLLKKKISEFDVSCWLVNTGWSGGVFGIGKRISIKDTRQLLNEALAGNLFEADMRKDSNFGFMVPKFINGIDNKILNPRDTWSNPEAYDTQANKLVNMFVENFKEFENDVEENVKSAGPIIN